MGAEQHAAGSDDAQLTHTTRAAVVLDTCHADAPAHTHAHEITAHHDKCCCAHTTQLLSHTPNTRRRGAGAPNTAARQRTAHGCPRDVPKTESRISTDEPIHVTLTFTLLCNVT